MWRDASLSLAGTLQYRCDRCRLEGGHEGGSDGPARGQHGEGAGGRAEDRQGEGEDGGADGVAERVGELEAAGDGAAERGRGAVEEDGLQDGPGHGAEEGGEEEGGELSGHGGVPEEEEEHGGVAGEGRGRKQARGARARRVQEAALGGRDGDELAGETAETPGDEDGSLVAARAGVEAGGEERVEGDQGGAPGDAGGKALRTEEEVGAGGEGGPEQTGGCGCVLAAGERVCPLFWRGRACGGLDGAREELEEEGEAGGVQAGEVPGPLVGGGREEELAGAGGQRCDDEDEEHGAGPVLGRGELGGAGHGDGQGAAGAEAVQGAGGVVQGEAGVPVLECARGQCEGGAGRGGVEGGGWPEAVRGDAPGERAAHGSECGKALGGAGGGERGVAGDVEAEGDFVDAGREHLAAEGDLEEEEGEDEPVAGRGGVGRHRGRAGGRI